jgi:hypothetical protein
MYHARKEYGGAGVQVHEFLTLEPVVKSKLGCFTGTENVVCIM